MTNAAWILLACSALVAIADWVVVSPGVASKRAEYVLKPATLLLLIALAAAVRPDDGAQRALFVVALVLSLAGDVFLMLPQDLFVFGLASFLLAHLAYIAGFAVGGLEAGALLIGVAVVAIALAAIGSRVIGVVRMSYRKLFGPVLVYMTVISAMVAFAFGSEKTLAIVGALLFYSSDTLIAWDRFGRPMTWARPAVMSTYHLAQIALVLSLVR